MTTIQINCENMWHDYTGGADHRTLEEAHTCDSGTHVVIVPIEEYERLLAESSEVKRLQRWKTEATEVLTHWDAVSERFDLSGHLGEFTADAVLEEIKLLQEGL